MLIIWYSAFFYGEEAHEIQIIIHPVADSDFYTLGIERDWKPGAFELLNPTERKPARTAVLIVLQPDDMANLKHLNGTYTGCRWQLGKKVWEQYMNVHPNVDCYFVQHTDLREGDSEQTWIEGNTIYVGVGSDSRENGGIPVSKTIAALEKLLPHYTHFFRANISAFVNLNTLNEYAETHHQSMFTGPLWRKDVGGYLVMAFYFRPMWHLIL